MEVVLLDPKNTPDMGFALLNAAVVEFHVEAHFQAFRMVPFGIVENRLRAQALTQDCEWPRLSYHSR